jgi:hypothetical protein
VLRKKKGVIDLLQCYVSNPSPATPILAARLLLDLQAFIRTPSFSLRLHLPGKIEHNPMHPIPNLNIMVELPP